MPLTRRQFTKALAAFGAVVALPVVPQEEQEPRRFWALHRHLFDMSDSGWIQPRLNRGEVVVLPSGGTYRLKHGLIVPANGAALVSYDNRIIAGADTDCALTFSAGSANSILVGNYITTEARPENDTAAVGFGVTVNGYRLAD